MARVLVLYNEPADPAAFDTYYSKTHVPLVNTIPGLRSFVISAERPRAIAGVAPYMVVALDFDNMDDLQRGLQSPEGQATSADLANFAADAGFTILVFDTAERAIA